jgi:hypothetical protein
MRDPSNNVNLLPIYGKLCAIGAAMTLFKMVYFMLFHDIVETEYNDLFTLWVAFCFGAGGGAMLLWAILPERYWHV